MTHRCAPASRRGLVWLALCCTAASAQTASRRSIACFSPTARRWRATANGRGSTIARVLDAGHTRTPIPLSCIWSRFRPSASIGAAPNSTPTPSARSHYAATRGEEDFARLSADVARSAQRGRAREDPAEQLWMPPSAHGNRSPTGRRRTTAIAPRSPRDRRHARRSHLRTARLGRSGRATIWR